MPEYRILQLGTAPKYRVQERGRCFWYWLREWYGDYAGGTWEILEYNSLEEAQEAITYRQAADLHEEEQVRAKKPGWHVVLTVSCKDA